MYEIIVKKNVTKQMPASQSYERISETGGEDGGPKWGYVTVPPYEKTEMITVYQQQVESLDIVALITAANNKSF